MRARAAGWLLCSALAAGACSAPTEIVAVVDSDIAPSRLPASSLTVRRLDGTALYGSCVALDGGTAFPLTLGMTPGASSAQRFRVIAQGHAAPDCADDPPLVEQSATVRFHDGKRELLALGLYDACVGVRCDAGQTCDPSTRGCVDDGREVLPPLEGADLATSPLPDLAAPDLATPAPAFLIRPLDASFTCSHPAVATDGLRYLLAFECTDPSNGQRVVVGAYDPASGFKQTSMTNPAQESAVGPSVLFVGGQPVLAYAAARSMNLTRVVVLDPSLALSGLGAAAISSFSAPVLAATTGGDLYVANFSAAGLLEVWLAQPQASSMVGTALNLNVVGGFAFACDLDCRVHANVAADMLERHVYDGSAWKVSGTPWPLMVTPPNALAGVISPGTDGLVAWTEPGRVRLSFGPTTVAQRAAAPTQGEPPMVALTPAGGYVVGWSEANGQMLSMESFTAGGASLADGGAVSFAPAPAVHHPRVAVRANERLIVWDDGAGNIWALLR